MAETEIQQHIDAAPDGVAFETVLVVEDEDLVRELARGILERGGYHVLEAASVEEAISIGRDHPGPVHLMLCDVVLPRQSGPEIFDALSLGRPEMRVLFMSGYPLELIDRRGLLPAGLPFIQKPFSPDELSEQIREILDS